MTAPEATKRARRLTIIAQDPSVRSGGGRILTAQVTVPVDRLEPGPRTHRFHVVDFDATTGHLVDPVADLCDPEVPEPDRRWTCVDTFEERSENAEEFNALLQTSDVFRAQNVYAIAARTLAAFEFALGRRLDWAFDSSQLYIVPRAFPEANAHYSREDRGLYFGYIPRGQGPPLYTCLSHDIVCHEATHAILDGLRPRFLEPSLPDQPAFHEALADIVALFLVFSLREVVEFALGAQDEQGLISAEVFDAQALGRNILFGVAEEFGQALGGVRGSALRRSKLLPAGSGWRSDPAFSEPHRRGEVLVAAVIDAMAGMWVKRLGAIRHEGRVSRARAAEEGARAAAHLLTMVIRSLDYAPTIELEFEDVLEAILVSDQEVAPEDKHDYRGTLERSFARFGIRRAAGRIADLSGEPLRYDQLNAAALRTSKQEAYRFIWQNASALQLNTQWHLQVEALRLAVRIGPDGLIVQEVVCDYVQVLELGAGQARELAESLPDLVLPSASELPDAIGLQFWGGGTLIFDQFGRAKLHQRKALEDWRRQSERVEYLLREGLFDSRGRLGFSTGTARGMAFADLHAPDDRAGEAW